MLGDKKDQMSIVVCESLPQVVVRPRMELLWMPRLGYRDNMDLRKRKETQVITELFISVPLCVCVYDATDHRWRLDRVESHCWSPAAWAGGPSGSRCPAVMAELDLVGGCGTNRPKTDPAWTGSDRSGSGNTNLIIEKKNQVRSRESFLDFRDY